MPDIGAEARALRPPPLVRWARSPRFASGPVNVSPTEFSRNHAVRFQPYWAVPALAGRPSSDGCQLRALRAAGSGVPAGGRGSS